MASSSDEGGDAKANLRAVMWGFPQTPQYKMLIVGQAGSGKSCFLSFLSNFHSVLGLSKIPDDAILTLRSKGRGSRTSSPTATDVCVEGVPLRVVDTPGFPDVEGVPDVLHMGSDHERQLRDALHDAQYVNCIVFVVRGTDAQMHPSVAETMAVIASLMPEQILRQVVFLFTHVDSAKRRAFPVPALREVVRGEPVCIHLDNPLGELTAMSEAHLMERLSSDDGEAAAEICAGLRKSARAVTELLTVAKDFQPVRVASKEGIARVPVWVWIGVAAVLALFLLGRRRAFLVVVACLVGLFWRGGGFQRMDTRQVRGSLLEMEAQTPVME